MIIARCLRDKDLESVSLWWYIAPTSHSLSSVQVSITSDFSDSELAAELKAVAGLMCVSLSIGGRDFVAFFHKANLVQSNRSVDPVVTDSFVRISDVVHHLA